MILSYLLENVETIKIVGNKEENIEKIEYDSKKIGKDDLFVAIRGYKEDGDKYISDAIDNGAKAIIIEQISEKEVLEQCGEKINAITLIVVENARIALADVSAKFYGYPAKQLKLIGITGTKGKTTTAYMIRDIMLKAGKKIGMIGTICITYGDVYIESERTSPESLELNKIFKDMLDHEIEYVVMEVSSHALELYRVYGMHFIMSVFTNLSHEHLDFHRNNGKLFKCKEKAVFAV